MQIDNQFQVPVPIEEAWLVLTDIERIAPCMPGATLDEVVDENTYKGSVAIRLGPVALSFNGQATFKEIDPQAAPCSSTRPRHGQKRTRQCPGRRPIHAAA